MADVKDDKYIRAYDKQLRIGEKKEIGAIRSYYQQQYTKGVDQFLKTGKTSGFTDLFIKNKFNEFYESIYVNIGLRFASWYADNIDKYIIKQLQTNNYKDTWETAFAKEGKRVAAVRVVTVQGTAKNELEKTLKKLMTDADFQSRGAAEKGRILRQRFNKLSRYQAERIVRTEATNAANLGVMQSATDVYGKNSLQKKWITSMDGRERSAHAFANGQIVDFNDKFKVGGEMLDRAGDPSGSAANVVNCRCAIAPFPKAEAQAITPLTGFDYGLSAGRAIGLDSANAVDDILKPKPQPVSEAAEEIINFDKLSKKQIDEFFVNEFKKQGISISKVNSNNLTKYQYKRRVEQFKKLSDEYNIKSIENSILKDGIELNFKTEKNGAYGRIERWQLMPNRNYPPEFKDGMLTNINFGNKAVNSLTNNQIGKLKFNRHFANINLDLDDLYVTTHEFGHLISTELVGSHKNFWSEFNKLKTKYFSDLNKNMFDDYQEVIINGQTRLTKYSNIDKYDSLAISNYANKNSNELMAEAFTEYKLSDTPSKWAIEFGKLIDKYFKK